MAKVTCVLGSPRTNGNSEIIARTMLETFENAGLSANVFRIGQMGFKGCIACMGCKTGSEKCVVKDDLSEVLDSVSESEILLIASPIYFGQITGQTKCYIDRMFSFLKPDFYTNPTPSRLASGKRCAFIITQGDPNEENYANAADVYANFFNRLFGYENFVVRGLGMNDKGVASQNSELLEYARTVAQQMLK